MFNWARKKKQDPPEPSANGTTDPEHRKRKLRDKFNDKNRWYWKFAQQNLPGWAPILTANWVVLYFFAVCVFCVALGVPILTASLGVKEYSVRYDNAAPYNVPLRAQKELLLSGDQPNVTVELLVRETMRPPVYVFYELESFYQNHKRYVRSRSDNQLGGKGGAASSCSPQEYVGGQPNSSLPNNGQINPCGLIAWSFFNDSFTVSTSTEQIGVDDSGIAWSYDRDHLYGDAAPQNFNLPNLTRGGNTTTVPVSQNEHLMVWLRPAVQPSFRKNYGKINRGLAAGTRLIITVQNRYNTYDWGGAKTFVVSTNSWVGGKNLFLGIIYLVVAGLAFLACLSFLVCYHLGLVKRRKFGDLSDLSWQRRQ